MKACLSITSAAITLVSLGGYAPGAVVFQDSFDTHTLGSVINTQVPPVGEWSFELASPVGFTVQPNPLGAGQVMRGRRVGSTLHGGFVSARATGAAPQINQVLTTSWDMFRTTGSSASEIGLYLGYGFFAESAVNVNSTTGEISYEDDASSYNSGVYSGTGGWERYKMVVNFGAVDGGGKLHPTYDLFFERLDVNNSLGVLAETQLANDLPIYNSGLTPNVGLIRWVAGMAPHVADTPTNPIESVVYYDNLQMTLAEVPEPASLGLLAATGLMQLGVRRRRA